MTHGRHISIWFFVGILLTIYGVIILAAGMGSRLVQGQPYPKPLQPVSSVPLLVRVLRILQEEGIREAVVVTGHLAEPLEHALRADRSLTIELSFVHNALHKTTANGVSVLVAREWIDGDVLLTMSDHLFGGEIVRRLRGFDRPSGSSVLAVDYDIARCFDLDDATKVNVKDGRIVAIGKELPSYNALDTGVFRIGAELVLALSTIFDARGDCSLSEGGRALSEEGRFLACDIGGAPWIDVDTPEALLHAEAMLAEP
jgi:choline kinase